MSTKNQNAGHDSTNLNALWEATGFTLVPDDLRVGYYSEIDMMVWAKNSTATTSPHGSPQPTTRST